MPNYISLISAVLGAFAFIALGAFVIQPEQQPATLRIDQIQTGNTVVYPYTASAGHMYCVEGVYTLQLPGNISL